jgi:NADH-quinone oxidoreductase subunit G
MVKLVIDDKEIKAKEGTTILNAAKDNGIKIPHFCYHPAFAPEGTCRMCLVEIEGLPKLELACSTPVREGMKVFTSNDRVDEARKGVLEFLLAEHPLDCPICDKAGECKLQDYFEKYGLFESRFKEPKEKRNKKINLGKYLLHDNERCVLCRRCVRFLQEVTKTQEMGVFERGIHTEVNIYAGTPVDNNYSGNLAEICPVGAITDKDFRFSARTWFLEKKESICPLCSRGCSIFIESHRGLARFQLPKRVYRIHARENPKVNGHWICDVGRYGYSYLDKNRLDRIRVKGNGDDESLHWKNLIRILAEKIKRYHLVNKSNRIALLINTWLTNEELFLIKKIFMEDLKVEKVYFVDLPEGKGDDFLLTEERTPNKKGAANLGFEYKGIDPDALADKTELLLIFGSFAADHPDFAGIRNVMDEIKMKVLFAGSKSELDDLADMILPVSPIAEKGGSLTNVDGIVQRFSPALTACGDSRAEWGILVDLAKEIEINFRYYSSFTSQEAVYEQMRKEISTFRK